MLDSIFITYLNNFFYGVSSFFKIFMILPFPFRIFIVVLVSTFSITMIVKLFRR